MCLLVVYFCYCIIGWGFCCIRGSDWFCWVSGFLFVVFNVRFGKLFIVIIFCFVWCFIIGECGFDCVFGVG